MSLYKSLPEQLYFPAQCNRSSFLSSILIDNKKGGSGYEEDRIRAAAFGPAERLHIGSYAENAGGLRQDAPLTVVQENMPEDFAVRFTWWYDTDRKNIMDTQEGLLQRDLVTEGTASVEFRPDTAFLQELYALVCEDGFLDIRRPMISQELTTDDTLVAVMPNCWYEIRVTKNAEQYLICGDMTAAAYTQTDADAACFMKTVDALLGLVKGTSAWASLPEPNAAYE